MENSAIPYEERELIQRAIRNARPVHHTPKRPRWALVKDIFGTGRTVSRAICTRYGFDPDREIDCLEPLSQSDYEDNL